MQANKEKNAPITTVDFEDDYDSDNDSDYGNDDFKKDLGDFDLDEDDDFQDEEDTQDISGPTPTPQKNAFSSEGFSTESFGEGFNGERYTNARKEGFNGEGFYGEGFTTESFVSGPTAKKGRKHKGEPSFRVYVYKVLKQVWPDTGISKKAMNQVCNLVKYGFEVLVEQANRLLRQSGKSTITPRELQSAVRLLIPGELARHAVSQASKAVYKFSSVKSPSGSPSGSNSTPKPSKKVSKSTKAGVHFPVGRVYRMIKKFLNRPRVSPTAPVYLTAVLEYLCAEVLELSGNAAKGQRRNRISPRHVFLAISGDNELHALYEKLVILNGGTSEYMHPVLRRPRDENGKLIKQKKRTSKKTETTTTKKTTAKKTTTKKTKALKSATPSTTTSRSATSSSKKSLTPKSSTTTSRSATSTSSATSSSKKSLTPRSSTPTSSVKKAPKRTTKKPTTKKTTTKKTKKAEGFLGYY